MCFSDVIICQYDLCLVGCEAVVSSDCYVNTSEVLIGVARRKKEPP